MTGSIRHRDTNSASDMHCPRYIFTCGFDYDATILKIVLIYMFDIFMKNWQQYDIVCKTLSG